jgi:hypothetical protein
VSTASNPVTIGSSSRDFLRLRRLSGLREHGFEVTARVANVTFTHDYVRVFRPRAFLGDLRAFEQSKQGIVTLEGNPDFRITIQAADRRGSASLRIHIGDPQIPLDDGIYGAGSFDGGFTIPGELLLGFGGFYTSLYRPPRESDHLASRRR